MKNALSRSRALVLGLTRVSALALIILAGGGFSSAFAIPTPFSQLNINGLPQINNVAGSFVGTGCDSLGNCQTSNGSAFYTLLNGNGSASASALAPKASFNITAGANIIVEYYFGVFGPFTGQIPLVIKGSLDTTAIVSDSVLGSASAGASATIFNGSTTGSFNACQTAVGIAPIFVPGICSFSPSLNFTDNLLVAPNPDLAHLGSVILKASAGADGGSASATNDPTIAFAPGFDSTGLTLEVSPDLPLATPEPGSASLLALGLGLVVALQLRPSFLSQHREAERS